MSWVDVPNTKINSLFNRPWHVSERDADGDPIFPEESPPGDVKQCEACGHLNKEPKMKEARTYDIILEIILAHTGNAAIRPLHKAIDGQRVTRLWNQADRCRDKDFLHLRKEEYDWLHGLLARKLPFNKDNKDHMKESGVEEKSVANHLFSGSDWTIVEQLKSMEDRDYEIKADLKEPVEPKADLKEPVKPKVE